LQTGYYLKLLYTRLLNHYTTPYTIRVIILLVALHINLALILSSQLNVHLIVTVGCTSMEHEQWSVVPTELSSVLITENSGLNKLSRQDLIKISSYERVSD
jgi:hypothetical protein